MKLSEFKFDLPNNLIALDPAENRDESRLMVVHKDSGKIEQAHKIFKNVGWGFALLLAAWLIVVTILRSLGADQWLLRFFEQ